MGLRLRVPAQIGEWLAGLAGSQPEAGVEIGAALTALIGAGEALGPPLVTDAGIDPGPGPDADPRELIDYQYQQLLEALQQARREVADLANQQWRLATQLEVAGLDAAMRAALERQLDAASRLEPLLSRRARRLQSLVDAIRTEKETAKAMITAAEAKVRIEDAAAELGHELTAHGTPGDSLGMAEEPGPGTERAASEWRARLERLAAEARRLLAAEDTAPAAARQSRARIRELHSDPLGSDARVLFAIEPADAIVLLSVLEDAQAVALHREEAIDAAAELLDEISDHGWPPGVGEPGLEFSDTDEFLTRFFPQARTEVVARAAALAGLTGLAELRAERNVGIAELADRVGWRTSAAEFVEADLRSAEIADVAAYVRGLGGTLRLTVSLDGRQHRLS